MNLGLAVWEWQKMDLIRSACNNVDVGGLELAVQNPEKGGDQD